mmetsp:Transcript_17477/g.52808  ORF Transcript_17477/g.52808 Transcript_17477/m.52808 type:complete len:372 (+) Transcript_17477:260-1375(+)
MAVVGMSRTDGGEAGPLEVALNAQRKFMDQYGDPLEQLLSTLVYLIPVQDEEDRDGYWSQAVYSFLDLFNLYRSALRRSPESLPVVDAAAAGPAAGVSSASACRSRRLRLQYSAAAFLLRALRSVQVLLEMRATRARGLRAALRVCLRIEVVKLALKLAMRSRTPFAFYVDEDALEAEEPPRLRREREDLGAAAPRALPRGGAAEPELPGAFVGRRSGKTLRTPGGTAAPAPPLGGLGGDASGATPQIAVAEALFHGRPLLHVVLLLSRGRSSWLAWLSALFVDVVSLLLLTPAVRHRPNSRAAALESAELKRRRAQLWWALARSPAYDCLFRRLCESLDRALKRIPVVNVFNVVELALALQPFYFTTSAS